ncbi:hypothetical protein B7463_g8993, partial [Scytalidium lignicola]
MALFTPPRRKDLAEFAEYHTKHFDELAARYDGGMLTIAEKQITTVKSGKTWSAVADMFLERPDPAGKVHFAEEKGLERSEVLSHGLLKQVQVKERFSVYTPHDLSAVTVYAKIMVKETL